MGELHEHPDGLIYVRASTSTYSDTRENYNKDAKGAAEFVLPPMLPGADDHIYVQGKRHAYVANGNVIDGGPIPWPTGDYIIEHIDELLAAQSARQDLVNLNLDMGRSMSGILTS